MDKLAIDGGMPVRETLLPYGRQSIDEVDIDAVADALRSGWLTTGPKVVEFERGFAKAVGAADAVSTCNGTAALHAAMAALEISVDDEVIVPALTFAASANCVLFQGGKPIFVDVDPTTLLIDPAQVEAKITLRTKAILAVDYTGLTCDYDPLRQIAKKFGIALVVDACHSLGGTYKSRPVGSLGDLNIFSFHPVKHITTGEGGMVSTDHPLYALRMRCFRSHGIASDYRQRESTGSWYYEMTALGYNYRLTDIQCALGLSQLKKLSLWIARRREIAATYMDAFAAMPELTLPTGSPDRGHAWHLFVVRLNLERLRCSRKEVFKALRAENIGVNVHYIPVPWHPYYQRLGYAKGQWPVAESSYERMLSLPVFPSMTEQDTRDVITAVRKVLNHFRK